METLKIGDEIICKPGFNSSDNDIGNLKKGGTGYREGLVGVINYFTSNNEILWLDNGNGIWCQAVRLLNSELNYSIW